MKPALSFSFMIPIVIIMSCTISLASDINAEELKNLISENPGLLIIDTRTEFEFKQGHIPKAINISQEKFYTLNTLLPEEKSTPIVFYCRGKSG